jgi:PIN domain nuclease of toxin-antitoxin system
MAYLVDTHAFLWMIGDADSLSPLVRDIVNKGHNKIYLSAASLWEMAIKINLGKLQLPFSFTDDIDDVLRAHGIFVLAIDMKHAQVISKLPLHHRDPFDRMLVAQAMAEGWSLISRDPAMTLYPVEVLW